MPDIKKVADAADMIVNGYAFTKCEESSSHRGYKISKWKSYSPFSYKSKGFLKKPILY